MDSTGSDQDVMELIAERLNINVERVTSDSRLVEDLGMKPSDIPGLIQQINKEFSIGYSSVDVTQMHSVQDLLDYVGAERVSPKTF
jgi:acyl carrier protein